MYRLTPLPANILQCPASHQPLEPVGDEWQTPDGSLRYRVVQGQPILVDFSQSILSPDFVFSSQAESVISRNKYGERNLLKRLVASPKDITQNNLQFFLAELKRQFVRPRVLVVGGGAVGNGLDALYSDSEVEVLAFDIYRSSVTQFVADAHQIPLRDGVVHGVIIQAVLEHVLRPDQVVAEIERVLAPQGLVFADTPFLQHVHEAAWDFTRFTHSGHRYLFRRFEHLRSGANGGPGQVTLWSVEYLVRGLTRSNALGKVAKLAFFWLKYLDRLIPESYRIDGASGTYFIGQKSGEELEKSAIIPFYQGAMR